MSNLFSPLTMKDLTLRNRIVMSPMCMYSADKDGFSSDWHSLHYATRAMGGVGLILQEATAVEGRGRITDGDLGIWDDRHVAGFKKIVQQVHRFGAKIGIQLAHAGRKCMIPSEDIISPSPVCYDANDPRYRIPREMNDQDIETVIRAFQDSASRAVETGYDLVQIHAAHGYLLNEFLTPLVNKRTDKYGGRTGGTELLREVIHAVRKVWPEHKPLEVRVSARDYEADGNEPEDLAKVLNAVKAEGVDSVNVSSGNVVPVPSDAYNSYQIPFAEIIRIETGLIVTGGGMVTDATQADGIIRSGRADMVFLGRELLRSPYWPLAASKSLGAELDYWPEQYKRAK
ncbi:MAG: NADPH dehydrogenase [Spirochaetales bacterium]|nr:NADPH dehydrogenase [Spirochaetales bacterium]